MKLSSTCYYRIVSRSIFIINNFINTVFISVKMATPHKRTSLSLKERVDVVKLLNSGKSSRVIADEYRVGRTQIQQIN